MSNFLEKLFGIDKIKEEAARAVKERAEAQEAAIIAKEESDAAIAKAKEESDKAVEEANELSRLAQMSAKDAATAKKESYVAILATHINDQNPRNGFFELDWNEQFILQLKAEGYWGENDEEIVDKWWREICRNVAAEEGISVERRASGYININNLGDGKSEVS